MLVLTRNDVETVLDLELCMSAMADALSGLVMGTYSQPPRVQYAAGHGGMRVGLMPAWRSGENPLLGVKDVVLAPENPARGLDSHQGAMILHDGVDGRVLAIIDAGALTAIRTAAVSAVATRALARPDVADIAILGTGAQARAHIAAMRHLFPGARIALWGRSPARAADLAAAAGARACATIAEATRDAGVICTVTAARAPILHLADVAPGCHVNAVGASAPDARELAADLIAAAALFVDSRVQAALECGELLLAARDGAPADADACAEIGEVLLGRRAGRREARERTVFKSLGVAVEDLAAAELALIEARRRGIGTHVDW